MHSLSVCDRSTLICHHPQRVFSVFVLPFSQPRKVDGKMAKAAESLDFDLCTLTLCIGRKTPGQRKVGKSCEDPLTCTIESTFSFSLTLFSVSSHSLAHLVQVQQQRHAKMSGRLSLSMVTLLPLRFLIFKRRMLFSKSKGKEDETD